MANDDVRAPRSGTLGRSGPHLADREGARRALWECASIRTGIPQGKARSCLSIVVELGSGGDSRLLQTLARRIRRLPQRAAQPIACFITGPLCNTTKCQPLCFGAWGER